MWPFRKKIVENTKKLPFRRHQQTNISAWDGLSIIEKFAMVVLPIIQTFIFYMMLDMTGLMWWVKLIIAISIQVLLMFIIWFLATWASGGYE
tara:strand:+ start:531 stop:806 length:276 start_codon:yes stop_codon:yes gene_type:complete